MRSWRAMAEQKKIRTEHEVKLDCPETIDAGVLERELEQFGARAAEPEQHHQITRYYDTPSASLAASGALLKFVRTYGGNDDSGWLMLKETIDWTGHIRHALEVAVAMHEPEVDSYVATGSTILPIRRARALLNNSALVMRPRLFVKQQRYKCWIYLTDGHGFELSVDRVLYTDPTRADAALAEQRYVEFEADGDQACLTELQRIAEHYIRRFGLRPSLGSKYEIGLAAIAAPGS